MNEIPTTEIRNNLIQSVIRETFGPTNDLSEENQNEYLSSNLSPLDKYITGVLFPQNQKQIDDNTTFDLNDESVLNEFDEDELEDTSFELSGEQTKKKNIGFQGDLHNEESITHLTNKFKQSSMGFSFRLQKLIEIKYKVSFAKYSKNNDDNNPGKFNYKRDPFSYEDVVDLEKTNKIEILENELELSFKIFKNRDDTFLISAYLVNKNTKKFDPNNPKSSKIIVNDCLFQVYLELSVNNENTFLQVDYLTSQLNDEEIKEQELLYRNKKRFSYGHGCATDWEENYKDKNRVSCNKIFSSFIPCYEIKPVEGRINQFLDKNKEFKFSMEYLSSSKITQSDVIKLLNSLKEDYLHWINSLKDELKIIDKNYKIAAEKNIQKCEESLKRISKGISILESDSDAFNAFKISNRAMLIQQVHSSFINKSESKDNYDLNNKTVDKKVDDYKSDEKIGNWRPFQIAFFLMNIESIVDEESDDRDLVDLLWFPTGGGKTEAYLGIAAFTIALRRIKNSKNIGTTIFMRYTLRLLTSDQFIRISSMILALEKIRVERFLNIDLGDEISSGLWVGKSLTPNRNQEAMSEYKQFSNTQDRRQKWIKEKNKNNVYDFKAKSFSSNLGLDLCPSCGSDLDVLTEKNKVNQKTLKMKCSNIECCWSKKYLPIYTIDDEIYLNYPTFIVSTVDKFAQLSWHAVDDNTSKIKSANLFAIENEWDPPSLIIQDELHLISHQLGSVFAGFEIIIDLMCQRKDIKPKIIASTATIKGFKKQCKTLFDRDSQTFPCQGLDAGDSYFANENRNRDGRKYIGMMTSSSSYTAGQRDIVASLIQLLMPFETKPLKENISQSSFNDQFPQFKNISKYATLVWYFNSTRELGQAQTLVTQDIVEQSKKLKVRYNKDFKFWRLYNFDNIKELSSNSDKEEIIKILKKLKIDDWKQDDFNRIDMLLTTCMISVGVDIGRLGLMLINGQPKNTSEYIQASSRVGRQHPGIVFTSYNSSKSRDRSHYEDFKGYHQSIYKYVEDTSSTPFTLQARERTLRSTIVSIAKLLCNFKEPDDINKKEKFNKLKHYIDQILERIKRIDKEEYEESKKDLNEWIDDWKTGKSNRFGTQNNRSLSTKTLCYSFGTTPHKNFHGIKAWPILSSMRDVDKETELKIQD
tara:strand:+ start:5157 stop:8606 length:3450 start_codon:yes stop_codon:yes gene_type:complete